jgi:hypothetical protein
MLDVDKRIKITELLQNQVTDISILREEPIVFNNSEYRNIILIVKPVLFKEYDKFLRSMSLILIKNYEVFKEVSFLSIANYDKEESIEDVIKKVTLFNASKEYKRFKKQAFKFIQQWSFVTKKRRFIKLKHNKRLCKKYIDGTDPSEFIHILFALFVMNFDIVKKNLLEFLRVFQKNYDINSTTQMDISLHGTSQRGVIMPKYSPRPFNESTLNLLEQQSKM